MPVKIKHSKYKNTGLIYELLVKQVTSDLVSRKDSPAVDIIRKFYSGNTALVQEYRLYKTIQEGTNLTAVRANNLVSEVLKAARKIDSKKLKDSKYKLISEIKANYSLEDFFSVTVPDYRALAALYCLFEADRSVDIVDPQSIVNNKATLLEHMTTKAQSAQSSDNLLQEFASSEKDIRLLTFKLLLEKFNARYVNFLPEQKQMLKQLVSIGSPKKLREYVNEEMMHIAEQVRTLSARIPNGIERIKLNESLKMLEPLSETEKVSDVQLVRVLQFYDLLHELQTL